MNILKQFQKLGFVLVLVVLGGIDLSACAQMQHNVSDALVAEDVAGVGLLASDAELCVALGERPENVQAGIDRVFETIKCKKIGDWNFGGDIEAGYMILGSEDETLLRCLASKEKDHIYIIDVGGAAGYWGVFAMKFLLQDAECQRSGKQFHIFSITGGEECREEVERHDNVELYKINKFKVENIDEEFSKRGFNFKNKIDLVVSCWTLKHLVDSFGTCKRIYSLLAPDQGKFMTHGFFFVVADTEEVQHFPSMRWVKILADSNPSLAIDYDEKAFGDGHFCLTRNSLQELFIPLSYTGRVCALSQEPKYSGQLVTVFTY